MSQAPERAEGSATKAALWAALIVAFMGWMFDGMEMGLYTWAVPPALKELLGTTSDVAIQQHIGYTVALFLVGMSVGGIFFGRLGDTLGRVKTMVITVMIYAVFTGLSGFCHNFTQLAICRFIGAMGLGGEWGLGVALVMETWPNTTRPLLAGLLGGAANVGFLVANVLTGYLAKHPTIGHFSNWRIALMLGFAPALLTLVVRLFVRESEKFTQAKEAAQKSRFGDLFRPEFRRHSLIGIAVSAVAVLGMWGVYQAWLQGWVQQLVTQQAHIDFKGVSEAVITAKATALAGKARAMVGLWMAIGSIIGAILGGLLAHSMGRRASYALFCAGSLVSALLLYLGCDAYGPKLLVLATILGVFAASFFGWLPLYLPELFPTRIRATGEGLTFNCGRIISAVGVLFTGHISQALGGASKACAYMSLIYVVGLVVIFFAPETKDCDLPE